MSQKKNRTSPKNVLKNNLWMMGFVWKYTPGYVIWMLLEGVIWGINNSMGIIYTKNLLDALGDGVAFRQAVGVVLAYAVYLLLFYVFHFWYWNYYHAIVQEKLHLAIHKDLFKHAVRLDISRYDDPVFYNDFVWAMDKSFSHAAGVLEDTGKLINRIVASFTLTGVLFSVDIVTAVVILGIAALEIFLTSCRNRLNLKYSESINPLNRKTQYINRVFRLQDYAKEMRVTRVSKNLLHELDGNTEKIKEVERKFGQRRFMISAAQNTVSVVGTGAPLLLILYKVMITGTVGLGGFAVAMNGIWTMSWLIGDLINRIMKYHEHGIFVEKIRCFMECEPQIQSGEQSVPPMESMTLRGLTFSYPGKGSGHALEDVNLDIRCGEKIAIVGYNGAGKTTLTKLLMRLYDPDSGEILYNGKNIKEYRLDELRNRVAAVFQDYRIFAASLAENVAGGPYTDDMQEKVLGALEKSTFGDKLQKLPDGIDTPLTREFDNSGTQLSGGEQQKVAIARAFFKDADLIILDEPSSALDPDAEYALNQAIASYANQKTVIFISHRLSTTRHADRIYMFEEGKIIESGSHEELMALDGKYAYMFNLQAEKYQTAS